MIRPLVGSRIRVETEIADPHSFVVADIAQFETALLNLVVNARDAMHGEGKLEISVREVGPDSVTRMVIRARRLLRGHFSP